MRFAEGGGALAGDLRALLPVNRRICNAAAPALGFRWFEIAGGGGRATWPWA